MITQAALNRTESRGGHFRADFPARDDTNWQKHTFVSRTERGLTHFLKVLGGMAGGFAAERQFKRGAITDVERIRVV